MPEPGIDIRIAAVDAASGTFAKAAENMKHEAASLGSSFRDMQREARASGEMAMERYLNSTEGMMRFAFQRMGIGIQAIIVGIVGEALEKASEKALEMEKHFFEGKVNAHDFIDEFRYGIPLIGSFEKAFDNINDLITGERSMMRAAREEVEAMSKAEENRLHIMEQTKEAAAEYADILEKQQRTLEQMNAGPNEKPQLDAYQKYQDALKTAQEHYNAKVGIGTKDGKDLAYTAAQKELEEAKAALKAIADEVAFIDKNGTFADKMIELRKVREVMPPAVTRAKVAQENMDSLESKKNALQPSYVQESITARELYFADLEKLDKDHAAEHSKTTTAANAQEFKATEEMMKHRREAEIKAMESNADDRRELMRINAEIAAKEQDAQGKHLAAQLTMLRESYAERIEMARTGAAKEALAKLEALDEKKLMTGGGNGPGVATPVRLSTMQEVGMTSGIAAYAREQSSPEAQLMRAQLQSQQKAQEELREHTALLRQIAAHKHDDRHTGVFDN